MQIRPEKIGDLIGPKGKTIRGIQEQTGAEINGGRYGSRHPSRRWAGGRAGARHDRRADSRSREVARSTGRGEEHHAFGAFVEITPGVEGLLHISELQHGRTEKNRDVVKRGAHGRVHRTLDELGWQPLRETACRWKPCRRRPRLSSISSASGQLHAPSSLEQLLTRYAAPFDDVPRFFRAAGAAARRLQQAFDAGSDLDERPERRLVLFTTPS